MSRNRLKNPEKVQRRYGILFCSTASDRLVCGMASFIKSNDLTTQASFGEHAIFEPRCFSSGKGKTGLCWLGRLNSTPLTLSNGGGVLNVVHWGKPGHLKIGIDGEMPVSVPCQSGDWLAVPWVRDITVELSPAGPCFLSVFENTDPDSVAPEAAAEDAPDAEIGVPVMLDHRSIVERSAISLAAKWTAGTTTPQSEGAAALSSLMEVQSSFHASFKPASTIRKGGLSPFNIRKICQHIDAHLPGDLSVTSLAEMAGLSPFHFARCFRVSLGLPPHQYVLERRLRAAKALLSQQEAPLATIAQRSGFQSQSRFTTVFRQKVGMTPGAYRDFLRTAALL